MRANQIYCVKCKKKVTPNTLRSRTTKNNRLQKVGKCPDCGCKCCKFVKSYKCECEKLFDSVKALNEHKKKVHTTKRKSSTKRKTKRSTKRKTKRKSKK